MSKRKLLIVDDEVNIRKILQVAFDKLGYQTEIAADGFEALKKFEAETFDGVLTDVTMPGMSGYELLRALKAIRESIPVVIMTAYGTIPQAIQAIRDGASEYVTKPFDLEHLKKVVNAAVSEPESSNKPKAKSGAAAKDADPFLAESPEMKDVLELVRQVADSRATVMIGGESGVGKEVVARALHTLSSRAKKPFVAVSCAAIPDTLLEAELFGHEKGAFTGADRAKVGKFEAANTGTLFLDEIGEIDASTQVKLLRVLQEREIERLGATSPTKVDVRVVTATHRDLRAAVDEGKFRLDLLYRLQVVEIVIPPLRERQADILPLAHRFLAKFATENGRSTPLAIDPRAEALLLAHSWPGNVRELENAMERATVLASPSADAVTAALLPPNWKRAA